MGVSIFIIMKYFISESQLNKLISKITGKETKQNFFSVIRNLLNGNKDQKVGDIILQSVKEGNYEVDDIKGTNIDFNINGFPIEVSKVGVYKLYLPLFSEKPLRVSHTICKEIFYMIADSHMNPNDNLYLFLDDMADDL